MRRLSLLLPVAGLALLAASGAPGLACTNLIVTPGAAVDGSAMITYSADSHVLYGQLAMYPAGNYLPGTLMDVYDGDSGKFLGRIPQAERTSSVVGLMNEHQVAIGETTFGGRGELKDPKGILDYNTLMQVGLQRGRTARQAIEVMTSLVAEHGYASSGESLSVSDPKEAWIFEIIGKGPGNKGAVWVARRIPDGFVSAHANQARIRRFPLNDPENCIYAPDVISFARGKGYFSGPDEEFSFADAYAPLSFGGLRFCEARVWSFFNRVAPSLKISNAWVKGDDTAAPLPLWIKPDRKLSAHDLMELMRDHFEGTEFDLSKGLGAGPFGLPYRWRPLTWEVDGVKHLNERSAATQQTGFSFVAQSRGSLPGPLGGIFWFGVDDAASSVYVPLSCGIRSAPAPFAAGVATLHDFSWDSAFWLFNVVANYAYSRYSDMIVDVKKVQRELEAEFLARQPDIDAAALELYQKSPEAARAYLTAYAAAETDKVMKRWRRLLEDLFVKYMDGNVKTELGQVTHPGYPEEWYRAVAKADQGVLKVTKLKNEPTTDSPVKVAGFFHFREEMGGLGEKVPADFPFGSEKLLLLPGDGKCGEPPPCCLTPQFEQSSGKLVLRLPETRPGKCHNPDWLVRLNKDEKRSLVLREEED